MLVFLRGAESGALNGLSPGVRRIAQMSRAESRTLEGAGLHPIGWVGVSLESSVC